MESLVLSPQDVENLEAMSDGSTGYFYKMLDYLEKRVEDGVRRGRFSEEAAKADLETALWYSYACNNLDEYESYCRAAQWMAASEGSAEAARCGMWYYRYSCALLYCGRLEEALAYLDTLVETGEIDQRALRNFWIQFQQAALNAALAKEMDSHDLLQAIEQGDKAGSLQEIQAALRTLEECFPQAGQPSDNEKKLVEQIRGYVEDNLDQSLTVNDVATALFMNGDYLSRLFKSETGTSLKEYILQRKMEAARLLLTTTQLPVSVIASRLGYDNFSYFSQVYRRCMGISPSDERKKK